jgi:hypothetical protein
MIALYSVSGAKTDSLNTVPFLALTETYFQNISAFSKITIHLLLYPAN